MRDLARKVRKHASELGIEIEIQYATTDSKPIRLVAIDTELGGRQFEALLGTRSTWIESARRFHELIYHARAQHVYLAQLGKCWFCGRQMNGQAECHHEKHRGRNGRDDRVSNLRSVCGRLSGGCDFHQREHGGGKVLPRKERIELNG